MALIIEDGSGVEGANSYATVDQLVEYATSRDLKIPDEVADQEVLLLRAMDYLESYEMNWYGEKLAIDQNLSWPRMSYWNYWYAAIAPYIPPQLIKAQIVIAIESQEVELFPTRSATSRATVRNTVGPITVEYANTAVGSRPIIPQAEALLRQLFGYNTGQLQAVRG
jgi:hypothetical protein